MIYYTIPMFDIRTVEKCLKNLKPSTAPDPDGILSFISCKCYQSLALVSTNIYNTSLSCYLLTPMKVLVGRGKRGKMGMWGKMGTLYLSII